MYAVDLSAYKHDFVDKGALAVSFDCSVVPLAGLQFYTPLQCRILVGGRERFKIGPTLHQVAVSIKHANVTIVVLNPVDDLIPVSSCRGEHVEYDNGILSVGLPCNFPAFSLFMEGGENEAATKPNQRAVEVS